MIEAYTDGGCLGNPGPGAWAYVLRLEGRQVKGSGGMDRTTNNRMELTAVIRALERVLEEAPGGRAAVDLHTDSMYVKNGITAWIKRWTANGWLTAAKKPVKNKDLWVELQALARRLEVRWNWVLGHSGDELNELCDRMVKDEMRSRSVS